RTATCGPTTHGAFSTITPINCSTLPTSKPDKPAQSSSNEAASSVLGSQAARRYRRPAHHHAARQPRPGDVLLFHRATGLNRVITWFTRSPYYHVAIYAGDSHV